MLPTWSSSDHESTSFSYCLRHICRDLKITTITNVCCLFWLSLRSLVFLQIRLLETSEVLFQAPIEFRLKFLCTLAPLLFFDVA